MVVAKRQRKEKAHENRTKEGSRTRVRNSGKTALQASPMYIGQAQGEEKSIQKEEPNLSQGLFFSSHLWAGPPSHLEAVFSFACQLKLSCNTDPSITSNFCCSETELRKLQTPLLSWYLCKSSLNGGFGELLGWWLYQSAWRVTRLQKAWRHHNPSHTCPVRLLQLTVHELYPL